MKIPFSPPDITEKEIEQVSEALRSGWITTGPKTKELEREVADLCGVNRAVCLNSQTACAEMTLRLLGIKEGDEVITCAYTYTASASVVCHVGAKLILIDTQRDSLEMDYKQLENAITEKTKVIIPVDLGGVPCDYDRIFSIVERKKDLFHPANKIQESIGRVIIMADAAHAFGATWKEKPVGSIADFSNFSFHALYKMKVKTDELVAEKEAKEVSEAIKDLDILTEKSKEENQDIRTLMFENLKELKEFYVICKQQIRKSFSAAMFSCFAGFMLFVLAVITFLLGGNNSASFMAGLFGAIVEIVSGLYFWMYKETSKQLGKYHKRLEATEKYLIALQIIEMLPEENRSEQYGKLIDYILKM